MTYSPKNNITYAGVASTTAAIASLALLLRQQKASGGEFTIPPELMELVLAMASDINAINTWIQNFAPSASGQGYPPNTPQINVYRRDFVVAGVAIQLNEMEIPDDFELVIKSWPTNPGPPAGLIYVSNSKANAENPLASYPLITNEFRAFRVSNANVIWVSATVLPAAVSVSVEKKP